MNGYTCSNLRPPHQVVKTRDPTRPHTHAEMRIATRRNKRTFRFSNSCDLVTTINTKPTRLLPLSVVLLISIATLCSAAHWITASKSKSKFGFPKWPSASISAVFNHIQSASVWVATSDGEILAHETRDHPIRVLIHTRMNVVISPCVFMMFDLTPWIHSADIFNKRGSYHAGYWKPIVYAPGIDSEWSVVQKHS